MKTDLFDFYFDPLENVEIYYFDIFFNDEYDDTIRVYDNSIRVKANSLEAAQQYAHLYCLKRYDIPVEVEFKCEPRFEVVFTSDAFSDIEDSFAVWDYEYNRYYCDEHGWMRTFPTEKEAEAYLAELNERYFGPVLLPENEGKAKDEPSLDDELSER